MIQVDRRSALNSNAMVGVSASGSCSVATQFSSRLCDHQPVRLASIYIQRMRVYDKCCPVTAVLASRWPLQRCVSNGSHHIPRRELHTQHTRIRLVLWSTRPTQTGMW